MRGRLATFVAGTVSALLLAAAPKVQGAEVNGLPDLSGALDEGLGRPVITCDIRDNTGAVVTAVSESSPGSLVPYWLHYFSDGRVSDKVRFLVRFRTDAPAASPLKTHSQVFRFRPASSTSIETPFGVPYWGGDFIQGPARLRVISTRRGRARSCTYDFTVVP